MRFTPTRVGNTPHGVRRARPRTVHPHSRGEHMPIPGGDDWAFGSPPLAWGTRFVGLLQPAAVRFTPTRVGNTSAIRENAEVRSVHPHSRGEHRNVCRDCVAMSGSPPLAWGTPLEPTAGYSGFRFTPTRVGNTPYPSLPATAEPVHPHSRGEHVGDATGEAATMRFTPTRVGNTRSRPRGTSRCSVHPHSRGEHGRAFLVYALAIGSPPLAWGTLHLAAGLTRRLRFTPTRVGNTQPPSRSRSRAAVHPHSRGEHGLGTHVAQSDDGSPPLAWGTLLRSGDAGAFPRFTPTRVGNTSRASCE